MRSSASGTASATCRGNKLVRNVGSCCACIGELTQRFSHLRLPLFPAFAATAGRLRTETHDASASLGQAKRHRLAAPTKDGFRHRGWPPQYFNVISASKARRVGPVMLDAARLQIGNL